MGLGPTWMDLIGRVSPDLLLVAQMTILGIVNATVRISNCHFQIWNLLKKWVYAWLEWTWSEDATWPAPGAPIMFWGIVNATGRILNFPLQNLESPQEMGAGTNLNGPNRRVSGVTWPVDYFGYSECYSGDIEFPSSDLESPPKMGLGAIWMEPIGGCHLTCFWCPNDYFGYSKCYSEDIKFPSSDLDSPQKMGLGMTWMDPTGGCHLTCSRYPNSQFWV